MLKATTVNQYDPRDNAWAQSDDDNDAPTVELHFCPVCGGDVWCETVSDAGDQCSECHPLPDYFA